MPPYTNFPLCAYFLKDRRINSQKSRQLIPAPRLGDMRKFPHLQRSTVMPPAVQDMALATVPARTGTTAPSSAAVPTRAPPVAPAPAPVPVPAPASARAPAPATAAAQPSLQQDKQETNREIKDMLQMLLRQLAQQSQIQERLFALFLNQQQQQPVVGLGNGQVISVPT
nr:E3 ubiquitin-protein ligase TRIM33-like [Penaeus vannamei]